MFNLFKPKYRLEVFQGKDGWYVRAQAKNGEILFITESYTRREDAVRSAVGLEGGRFVIRK